MIEINNLTSQKLDFDSLKFFFQRAIKRLKIKKLISLALVDSELIKKLNKIYRQKNKETDVLSFAGQDDCLGEIIISLSMAQGQALKAKHSLEKEIKILFIHSLFHLLGYDHQNKKSAKVMEEKEIKLLNILEK
jgi:probable rRNA maturation factor